MSVVITLVELVISLAMWYGLFIWIRNMCRKHKAKPRTYYHDVIFNGDDGNVHGVHKMCQDKQTKQVFFPESEHPDKHYYLTHVSFSPEYKDVTYTVKGKPPKRGHYVRNTVLFGVVGLAATHDKPGTADKTYHHNRQVAGHGELTLYDTDFQHEYTAYFSGKNWDASGFATYVYDPNEDKSVKSPSMTN